MQRKTILERRAQLWGHGGECWEDTRRREQTESSSTGIHPAPFAGREDSSHPWPRDSRCRSPRRDGLGWCGWIKPE